VAGVLAGRSAGKPAAKYGGLPSWLPKAEAPAHRTATASAAHPWLAVEGDTVSARLTRGRVLVNAVGPAVPEEGTFPVRASTRCTFTVTFRSPSGVVRVDPRAFLIVDELGALHRPRVAARGRLLTHPVALRRGQTLRLALTGVLPTGNGHLIWAPAGTRPLVSWDFSVEID
jgi:hypothetical protein